MTRARSNSSRPDSDRGAVLVLTIVVMVVIGLISAGLLAIITSGVQERTTLDAARNREYAADAAIETAIARVRGITTAPGVGLTPCAPNGPDYTTLNSVRIRVDCANAPAATRLGALERDVVFTACVDATPSVACTDSTGVIRAQVSFQTSSPSSLAITRTYVQSWSVNK
jgi:Tfp pilus assembly protein PilX